MAGYREQMLRQRRSTNIRDYRTTPPEEIAKNVLRESQDVLMGEQRQAANLRDVELSQQVARRIGMLYKAMAESKARQEAILRKQKGGGG